MTPAPKRHWFQFSLRTLFVVVAILAWGLATRPYLVEVGFTGSFTQVSNGPDAAPSMANVKRENVEGLFGISFEISDQDGLPDVYALNPRLCWPLLALTCFLGWKIVQSIVAWQRKRRRTPELH